MRRDDRGTQCGRNCPCFAKVRRRIKVRRYQNERAIDTLECGCQLRNIINVRARQLAAALRPRLAFADIARHSSNGLLSGQKVASHLAADLASDSSNGKHPLILPGFAAIRCERKRKRYSKMPDAELGAETGL